MKPADLFFLSPVPALTTFESIFPAPVCARGRGLTVRHGWRESPYGPLHIGLTDKGICWIGLETRAEGRAESERRLRQWWPAASFTSLSPCALPDIDSPGLDMPLDLHGTIFHLQVWRALRLVERGRTCTYRDLARAIGRPAAARAVGGAVGANPVSILVPCHRVLPSGGGVGNYGWGSEVKRQILGLEGVKV